MDHGHASASHYRQGPSQYNPVHSSATSVCPSTFWYPPSLPQSPPSTLTLEELVQGADVVTPGLALGDVEGDVQPLRARADHHPCTRGHASHEDAPCKPRACRLHGGRVPRTRACAPRARHAHPPPCLACCLHTYRTSGQRAKGAPWERNGLARVSRTPGTRSAQGEMGRARGPCIAQPPLAQGLHWACTPHT